MQYQQGSDYTSPYYPNPYSTTTSSYPNPAPIPNPTPTPNTNPNPMDFNSSNPIQSSYASAPPYTPYPPEIPTGPSYSYGQPPQSQYQSQFQPQSSQYPSYPPHNPTQYPPDSSPSPSPAPASYYPNFSPPNPSPYPSLDVPYETGMTNQYGRSMSSVEPSMYSKKPSEEPRNEGVYAYSGGNNEPYGARGIMGNSSARSNSSSSVLFDDYGRSISTPSNGNDRGKIVKAVPKMDTEPDVKSGVQKFRVKLLPEGAGSNMDVLCQVGLDGIKMLDPSTSRLLRIYPLESLTRWEVLDSSVFAFWSKSTVDVEPRRIRLKSSSYTTSTILDTVTAATVQFKEMGGSHLSRGRPASDAGNVPEQSAEKRKVFWMNFMKPPNEEKDHWVPDEAVSKCTACGADFGAFVRRHHCRNCGDIFCDKCTQGRTALTAEDTQPVRVCDRCMAEVSQRLSNSKEAANRPIVQSHEDLARKLQEEMDKNRKSSSASKSESGRRMREVACPVCTVHLQVQVPTSGSETIECGVCQHPFLVSAR
ncbi:protein FREE1-like [Carex rostrata]